MKTKYRYIDWRKDADGTWYCYNTKHSQLIGWAVWEPGWKCNIFSAESADVIFSASCLRDIADFLGQLDNVGTERRGITGAKR